MEETFLAQLPIKNRYLIDSNAINNNDKHILTSYHVRYRAQHFTCITHFNLHNNSMN